jgi:hypothetical protein
MDSDALLKKVTVVILLTFFIRSYILPTISADNIESHGKAKIISQEPVIEQEEVKIIFYSLGLHEQSIKEIEIPYSDVEELLGKITVY